MCTLLNSSTFENRSHTLSAEAAFVGRLTVCSIITPEVGSCRYENSVDGLQWLPVTSDSAPPGAMVLVSSGGDGVLRVWSVQALGHLMCTLRGATGHLETVKDMCVDENYERMILGDSSGHVRMWDVSELDTSSSESLQASFKQVHFSCLCLALAQGNKTVFLSSAAII